MFDLKVKKKRKKKAVKDEFIEEHLLESGKVKE